MTAFPGKMVSVEPHERIASYAAQKAADIFLLSMVYVACDAGGFVLNEVSLPSTVMPSMPMALTPDPTTTNETSNAPLWLDFTAMYGYNGIG